MISEEAKQFIISEVHEHYDKRAHPYYLAELGQFFRSNDIEIPTGRRFKDFLAENFQNSLVITQDPIVPAKIAIALPENYAQVQEQLAGRFAPSVGRHPIEVNRLPFSLIAAFCQWPSTGLQVYYRPVRPARYVVGSQPPDDSFVEIAEHFRHSLAEGVSIRDLTIEDKQAIYARISEWTSTQNVNLESIYIQTSGRSSTSGARSESLVSNALQRLIEAQEPDIRKMVQIPGDIALALMRIE